jgi:hypothetical protein
MPDLLRIKHFAASLPSGAKAEASTKRAGLILKKYMRMRIKNP